MTPKRKKVLFVQLPVPTFTLPGTEANIPLAAGCLASWGQVNTRGWDFEILPPSEMDLCGDRRLIKSIIARKPDLVAFSLYLWNSERSAGIAKELRSLGIFTVAGGPEVEGSNAWVTESGAFDILLSGEGEALFASLLKGFTGNGASARIAECDLINLGNLPSPYMSGYLSPYPDGSVWLETVRGCPFDCAYCNYGKRFSRVRRFGESWLPEHLEWFKANGGKEVYLMDPSFNVRPDWEETLLTLERASSDGVLSFHTELVAEKLRDGDAKRLAKAGLASCEVGLQTTNLNTLNKVGRRWEAKGWLRRMKELGDEGIMAPVGLIVGLPGDTLDDFKRSLEFVLTELPHADIQLFPLAILPGTQLAEEAEELGLLAFGMPPYTLLTSQTMTGQDISEAFLLFEEATGLELDPFGNPPLSGSWDGPLTGSTPLTGAKLTQRTPIGVAKALLEEAGTNFTFIMEGWSEVMLEEVAAFSKGAPHAPLTIILNSEPEQVPARIRALRAKLYANKYLERYFAHLGRDLIPRIGALIPASLAGTVISDEIRRQGDVILTINVKEGWQENAAKLATGGESVFVTGKVATDSLDALAESLAHDAVGLFFADEMAQREWERLIGQPPTFATHRRTTY